MLFTRDAAIQFFAREAVVALEAQNFKEADAATECLTVLGVESFDDHRAPLDEVRASWYAAVTATKVGGSLSYYNRGSEAIGDEEHQEALVNNAITAIAWGNLTVAESAIDELGRRGVDISQLEPQVESLRASAAQRPFGAEVESWRPRARAWSKTYLRTFVAADGDAALLEAIRANEELSREIAIAERVAIGAGQTADEAWFGRALGDVEQAWAAAIEQVKASRERAGRS